MNKTYLNSTQNLPEEGRHSSLTATVMGEGKSGTSPKTGNEWANHNVYFAEQVVEDDGTIVHYPRTINVSGFGAAAQYIKNGAPLNNGSLDKLFVAGNQLNLTGHMKPNQWSDADGVEHNNIQFKLESVSRTSA
tara:strand:+ start:1236 stop:1637 length:402 start_codon:yes stop_codon:yes gene_type:complete